MSRKHVNLPDPPKDRKGNFMQSISGKAYWPLDPKPEEFLLKDAVWACSLMCRYGGHVKRFYSVDEHMVRVAWLLRARGESRYVQRLGLCHDIHEGYIQDLIRPIKRLLSDYDRMEKMHQENAMLALGMGTELHPAVHKADIDICVLERMALCNSGEFNWKSYGVDDLIPDQSTIRFAGWPSWFARYMWWREWKKLTPHFDL